MGLAGKQVSSTEFKVGQDKWLTLEFAVFLPINTFILVPVGCGITVRPQ